MTIVFYREDTRRLWCITYLILFVPEYGVRGTIFVATNSSHRMVSFCKKKRIHTPSSPPNWRGHDLKIDDVCIWSSSTAAEAVGSNGSTDGIVVLYCVVKIYPRSPRRCFPRLSQQHLDRNVMMRCSLFLHHQASPPPRNENGPLLSYTTVCLMVQFHRGSFGAFFMFL